MFRIIIALLLLHCANLSPLREQRRQVIERVKKYLELHEDTLSQTKIDWLVNSNKISFGYKLFEASPMCYTGDCKMNEFGHPIFKLNYSSPVPGSCTDKLVPNNVEIDCLPSTTQSVKSETIETKEHLHQLISNKVEVSMGAKYKVAAFSYKYSKETKTMLDTIIEKQQVATFTAVDISYAKLSIFEPKMELSDNFRYVIEHMLCCEENDIETEEYVKDIIMDKFGIAYISSMLLGGVAQQTAFISHESKEELQEDGIQVQHEAAVALDLSFGSSISASTGLSTAESTSNYNKFMKAVKTIDITTLGGDRSLNNFDDWSKTVTNEPVIIKLKVHDILRLLTKHNFPMDSLIANKSNLIEKIIEKYVNNSVTCDASSCGNGTHGICEPTGFFGLGVCVCKPEWTGNDCETPVEDPRKILHGTICGFDRSFIRVNCGGLRPWTACPTGWSNYVWHTDLTVCYKSGTIIGTPMHGTICGIHSYHNSYIFNINIGCNNSDSEYSGKCPENYELYNAVKGPCHVSSPYPAVCNSGNAVCIATNVDINLPGTLCGMQIENTVNGPTCDGFNPGLRQCPPNYILQRTAFGDSGFMVCVKMS